MSDKRIYPQTRNWIHRNARELELKLWEFLFEGGDKTAVVKALEFYQNEDGGFGNALEPDNHNTVSSPCTTAYAVALLDDIGFSDVEHPICMGILRYLSSKKDFDEFGWHFSIESNDDCPCAPWYCYNEDANKYESIGTTATLASFALRNAAKESELYLLAAAQIERLISMLISDAPLGDMGLGGMISLVDALNEIGYPGIDYCAIKQRLCELVPKAIEHDTQKWEFYGTRPSDFVKSPTSAFYEDNKEIVTAELDYLTKTFPDDGVWGITWTWFERNEKYAKEFAISEVWWKSIKAIEKIRFLLNFGRM